MAQSTAEAGDHLLRIIVRLMVVIFWAVVTIIVQGFLLMLLFWLSVMQRLGFLRGLDITFTISLVLVLNALAAIYFVIRLSLSMRAVRKT